MVCLNPLQTNVKKILCLASFKHKLLFILDNQHVLKMLIDIIVISELLIVNINSDNSLTILHNT